jgi:hypothetical protein
MTTTIEDYIITEYTFERMKSDTDFAYISKISKSYLTFLKWNFNCINELSDKDKDWLTELCKRIGGEKINLMDEENCVAFKAYKIYFDENKKICIVSPR